MKVQSSTEIKSDEVLKILAKMPLTRSNHEDEYLFK